MSSHRGVLDLMDSMKNRTSTSSLSSSDKSLNSFASSKHTGQQSPIALEPIGNPTYKASDAVTSTMAIVQKALNDVASVQQGGRPDGDHQSPGKQRGLTLDFKRSAPIRQHRVSEVVAAIDDGQQLTQRVVATAIDDGQQLAQPVVATAIDDGQQCATKRPRGMSQNVQPPASARRMDGRQSAPIRQRRITDGGQRIAPDALVRQHDLIADGQHSAVVQQRALTGDGRKSAVVQQCGVTGEDPQFPIVRQRDLTNQGLQSPAVRQRDVSGEGTQSPIVRQRVLHGEGQPSPIVRQRLLTGENPQSPIVRQRALVGESKHPANQPGMYDPIGCITHKTSTALISSADKTQKDINLENVRDTENLGLMGLVWLQILEALEEAAAFDSQIEPGMDTAAVGA